MIARSLFSLYLVGVVSTSWASDSLTYALSEDCLETINVEHSDDRALWWLSITASADESVRIEDFTRQHVGKKLMLLSSNGFPLLPDAVTIQAPLSERFRIVVSTEGEARQVLRLLARGGGCGPGV